MQDYDGAMSRSGSRERPTQGQRLAQLRQAAGFSQRALAKAIGEPQQTLANWELSDRPPRSDVLPRLAAALNVSIEELLDIGSPSLPKKPGPPSKLQQLVDEVGQMSRRQQQRAFEVLAIFVEQERRRAQ